MRIIKIKTTTTTTIIIVKKKSLADHSDTYRLEAMVEIGGGGAVPNGEDLDPIPSNVASQMHDEGGIGVGFVHFFEP